MTDPSKPQQQTHHQFAFGGMRKDLLDVGAGFWELRSQLTALYGPETTAASLQRAGVVIGTAFANAFAFDISVQSDDGGRLESDAEPDLDGLLSAGKPNKVELAANAFRDCLETYQREQMGQFDVDLLSWPNGIIRVQALDTFEVLMSERWGHHPEHPVCDYTSGVLLGFAKGVSGRGDLVCLETACQAKGDLTCQFEISASAAYQGTEDERPVDAFDSQRIDLLDSLFSQIPVGAAILDQQLRIRHHNSHWDRVMKCFRQQEPPGSQTGADMLPSPFVEAANRALSGESLRLKRIPAELAGKTCLWDMLYTPLKIDDALTGVLHIVIDVTEGQP